MDDPPSQGEKQHSPAKEKIIKNRSAKPFHYMVQIENVVVEYALDNIEYAPSEDDGANEGRA